MYIRPAHTPPLPHQPGKHNLRHIYCPGFVVTPLGRLLGSVPTATPLELPGTSLDLCRSVSGATEDPAAEGLLRYEVRTWHMTHVRQNLPQSRK